MRGLVEDQIADHSCRFNPRLCHLCIRRRHIQQIEVAFGACNSRVGRDSHMGRFFIWHILFPIETFAKVEAMSESRSIEDLPIIICCSFGWIPVFS